MRNMLLVAVLSLVSFISIGARANMAPPPRIEVMYRVWIDNAADFPDVTIAVGPLTRNTLASIGIGAGPHQTRSPAPTIYALAKGVSMPAEVNDKPLLEVVAWLEKQPRREATYRPDVRDSVWDGEDVVAIDDHLAIEKLDAKTLVIRPVTMVFTRADGATAAVRYRDYTDRPSRPTDEAEWKKKEEPKPAPAPNAPNTNNANPAPVEPAPSEKPPAPAAPEPVQPAPVPAKAPAPKSGGCTGAGAAWLALTGIALVVARARRR